MLSPDKINSPAPLLVKVAVAPLSEVEIVLVPVETVTAALPTARLPPLKVASVKSIAPETAEFALFKFKVEPAVIASEPADSAPPVRVASVAPETVTTPAVTPPASTARVPPLPIVPSLPAAQAVEAPAGFCQLAATPFAHTPSPPVQFKRARDVLVPRIEKSGAVRLPLNPPVPVPLVDVPP